MPPKGKKKDPNAPTNIPEDTYVRAKKLQELKVAMKQPKGEFTNEEWCIPPIFHTVPEFKHSIHFWQQCAIVQYNEREKLQVPTRVVNLSDESKSNKKPHPRKELQDILKYLKGQVKQATKRTGQFLKQLEKKEGKELKREALLKQIKDVDDLMNEELRTSRTFVEQQQLFLKKYMVGSKLGEQGPRKNALVLVEQSDKLAQWADEAKDEIMKLVTNVLEPETGPENLNFGIFSGSAVTTWCPTFQSKTDPKKGLPDALKWINKNVSAKVLGGQSFPPDWAAMLNKFSAEGQQPPWRIYICCTRMPEAQASNILEVLSTLRAGDPPAKGEPLWPINIVAFDGEIAGNDPEKAFFAEVAGPSGSFLIDTSADDLIQLDKMLKSVQVKKKQLDKLNKKLEKMEDLSARLEEDRSLLQMQIALQRMLENDYNITDWALKNEEVVPEPEI